ncbi:MAG: antitoxin [Spirochaetota bacterium]|nr:antitoxin [Spirochaetota bacterium]
MKKKYNPDSAVLDKEEQLYEKHFDEYIPGTAKERNTLIQAARNTITEIENKTERMNIRVTKRDMNALRTAALREGLPYQSMVTSILHKYTTGKLVDIDEARKIMHV